MRSFQAWTPGWAGLEIAEYTENKGRGIAHLSQNAHFSPEVFETSLLHVLTMALTVDG